VSWTVGRHVTLEIQLDFDGVALCAYEGLVSVVGRAKSAPIHSSAAQLATDHLPRLPPRSLISWISQHHVHGDPSKDTVSPSGCARRTAATAAAPCSFITGMLTGARRGNQDLLRHQHADSRRTFMTVSPSQPVHLAFRDTPFQVSRLSCLSGLGERDRDLG